MLNVPLTQFYNVYGLFVSSLSFEVICVSSFELNFPKLEMQLFQIQGKGEQMF